MKSRAGSITWVVVLSVLVVGLMFAFWPTGGSESASQRAHRLAQELRCVECQGLSVADANTPSARAIRTDIAKRIDERQSDGEIRQAYVNRYGEDILLRPDSSGTASLLWVLPVVVFGIGGALVGTAVWRKRAKSVELTQDDIDLVTAARIEEQT